MKQIFQNLKTGIAETLEIPRPSCPKGCLLIQSTCSLISPGTERMLLDFGKASWLSKARQQPEKVKQVLQKMRTDGIDSTVKAVFSKLDQPLPVGYSNIGVVQEVGVGVEGFFIGDRVVSNGYHAELVAVPQNLCAKIPDTVSNDQAAFTVLSAIALQGVRLSEPTLGETFVVYGLGLIGQLTCQLLLANGCKVIGIDLSEERIQKANEFGAEAFVAPESQSELLQKVLEYNGGKEVDGVLITANTKSNTPIEVSPAFTRKRGRIVLVGVVGLTLERNEFFKKEITFQVSCSYGPGRYEDGYEKHGLDYPIGFVRWTEQRNFEAVLELFRTKRLQVESLISERIPFEKAASEYERILTNGAGYGFLFEYDSTKKHTTTRVELVRSDTGKASLQPKLSFIGAGNYTRGVLLPAFSSANATLSGIISQSGQSSADLARKFGFAFHGTEASQAFSEESDAVVIATRHNTHAPLVLEALQARKHVFVEKPLCLTRQELSQIKEAYKAAADLILMVGFNRRYSPLTVLVKEKLAESKAPLSFQITVNAGAIPQEHWTQKEEGGGRVLGEVCHFIDFAHHLAGAPLKSISAHPLGETPLSDTLSIALSFENGSIGTINYFANGNKAIPKERIEVFQNGKVLVLNNFLSLKAHGFSGFKGRKLWSQDKGQKAQAEVFLKAIKGEHPDPKSLAESSFETMEATFQVLDSSGALASRPTK